MKRNFFKTLLVAGLTVVSATTLSIGVSACTNDPDDTGKTDTPTNHTHTYSGWVKTDENKHWKTCTGADCTDPAGTKYSEGDHDTTGADGSCSVCGYKAATTPVEHTHTYSDWVKTDENKHWQTCIGTGCTDAAGTKYNEADHDENGTDGACSVCGYKKAAPTHNHVWAETYTTNENKHYYACTAAGHTGDNKDEGLHVDANNDGKCDTCNFGTVAEKAAELLAKQGVTKVVADNFIVNRTLANFTDYGTAGIYQGKGTGTDVEADIAAAYVEIKDGKASLKTPNAKPATYLYLDFGTISNAVIEGYFELSGFSKASGFTPVQFAGIGTEKEEVFGLRANTTWQYRLDGGSNVSVTGAPNVEGSHIYFSYNTMTKKITLTVNGTAFVTDLQLSGTGLKGIKFSSGDSNDTTYSIDNIAVVYTAISVDNYKTTVNANVTALETAANALKSNDAWSSNATADALTTAKTAVTGSITSATTIAEVDEAYATYETAVLAALKTEYEARLEAAYPANKYTVNATAYGTAMTSAKATINGVTTVSGFDSAYTTACGAFANVEDDDASTIADVTIVIKNADNEQVGTLTVKAGDTVTVDNVKAKTTVPAGKEIEGYYEEVAFTTAVTAFDTTAQEDKTITVYVKLVDKSVPDSVSLVFQSVENASTTYATIAANTKFVDNDLFSITNKVKLEYASRDSSNSTYLKDVTLHDGTAIADLGSGVKYNNVAKATTDNPTVVQEFATFEAKANISIYIYIKASDSSYKANRTKTNLVAKIVHADGSADTVNAAVAFTNRDKLQEFTYTLLKGDKVVITIENTDTGNSIHVWLFGVQAELTKATAPEATPSALSINTDEVDVSKNNLA